MPKQSVAHKSEENGFRLFAKAGMLRLNRRQRPCASIGSCAVRFTAIRSVTCLRLHLIYLMQPYGRRPIAVPATKEFLYVPYFACNYVSVCNVNSCSNIGLGYFRRSRSERHRRNASLYRSRFQAADVYIGTRPNDHHVWKQLILVWPNDVSRQRSSQYRL
jgi:hypothetical protein